MISSRCWPERGRLSGDTARVGGDRQMIARIAPIAGPLQGTQFDQFRQIARSRRRGGIGDRAIVVCAEAPDEPVQIGRAHVELQSLMRISYAVLCLKKKKNTS